MLFSEPPHTSSLVSHSLYNSTEGPLEDYSVNYEDFNDFLTVQVCHRRYRSGCVLPCWQQMQKVVEQAYAVLWTIRCVLSLMVGVTLAHATPCLLPKVETPGTN